MNSCFFFNDTATTEIYTLSLHDALPIFISPWRKTVVPTCLATGLLGKMTVCLAEAHARRWGSGATGSTMPRGVALNLDRKSTRLNSSHANISYAVFCLKKKKIMLAKQST